VSFDLACQTAIYTRLSRETPLTKIVKRGIYSDAPKGAKFPYVVIGDDVLTDFDTSTENGAECDATIHTWSHRLKEVKEVQAKIRNALHNKTLEYQNYNFEFCFWTQSQSFQDDDGEVFHGVCNYRIFIREG